MLSREEKKEMLEDAKSKRRRELFRVGRKQDKPIASMDEYISFLDAVQKIFSPFKSSSRPTPTAHNKL